MITRWIRISAAFSLVSSIFFTFQKQPSSTLFFYSS